MTRTHLTYSTLILKLMIAATVALVLLSFTGPVYSKTDNLKFPVIRVVDGDTISILYHGKPEKIRMLNVDTPESVHPDPSRNSVMGKKASDYTRCRLSGQSVSLEFESRKRGKYGRLLAYVILDGENYNLELVREGWSPYYTKYGTSAAYHERFTTAQHRAKIGRVNIWDPVKRDLYISYADQKQVAVAGGFHGNVKSKIFHKPGCRYYQCKNCTRSFSDRNAAARAGFSPCKICKP